jgi:glutamyl-tRNA synthetase
MRTRYAPSPTGSLHVGGLRTALYNWLLVRQKGGQFLLRIEDTDQEREVPGAVEQITRSFAWAGLPIDEGVRWNGTTVEEHGEVGPYTQSKRTHLYREHADILLATGKAYRCFCTKERLEEMRKRQEERRVAPMYDRTCVKLSREESDQRAASGEAHVVRLLVPERRTVTFVDAVRGEVSFESHTIDDQVLMKSDGFPTYHLANVVDDHAMRIDLVMRGEEWLSSTPKHILLYEAFGWTPPQFAHLPLLLNKDRTKLSKRQNSVSTDEYIGKGYLPETLLNFLALLGWNPGTTQEVFSLDELVQSFSLERVQKAGAIFDLEKLDWLQGQWMRKIPLAEFTQRCLVEVVKQYPAAATDPLLEARCALIQERVTFFPEAVTMLAPFYAEPVVTRELLCNEKQKVTPELLPEILTTLSATLGAVPEADWHEPQLLAVLREAGTVKGWKLGQILWPLRAALTGQPFSPGATDMAAALGKAVTLARLQQASA